MVKSFEQELIKGLRDSRILSQIIDEKEVTKKIKEELDEYIIKYKQDYIW